MFEKRRKEIAKRRAEIRAMLAGTDEVDMDALSVSLTTWTKRSASSTAERPRPAASMAALIPTRASAAATATVAPATRAIPPRAPSIPLLAAAALTVKRRAVACLMA